MTYYNFNWYGKEEAIKESFTPTNKILKPDKKSSKNWDDTENLYIEGDNLEVLKLLQKSYFGKVKMIYIDPPYNTGKDFVYKDNFKDNITNYKEITSQTTKANSETNGRYHTDWLNMMYPRLKLARNLLREDGVIFISIDDNEEENLSKMCNEIFGEDNIVAKIPWQARQSVQNDTDISSSHEYIVTYAKNRRQENRRLKEVNCIQWYKSPSFACYPLPLNKSKFSNIDNDDRGIWKADPFDAPNIRPNLTYPITNPNTGETYMPPRGRCWRTDKENYQNLLNDNRIVFGKNGDSKPQLKVFYNEKKEFGSVSTTWFDGNRCGTATNGTKELQKIFNGISYFDTPKPTKLLKELLLLSTKKDDIVLDFFSGSSTTADAVMQLNIENNENRKFIMVQIPEHTEEKSEAYEAGYKNICEIGKERIRRAGDKIVSENKDKEGIENLDIGFKVFKLEEGVEVFKNELNENSIKVEWVKRPKGKPLSKFKIDGCTYYLTEDNDNYIVFLYKAFTKDKVKGEVIASIFDKEKCKNADYMQLEYLYNIKLNEFNKEEFVHSQYVTSVILDKVYKCFRDNL